ncbi:MAG: hypothetical protein KHX05_03040 [Firmicutes bacterium]|nr:hypothetical protein [Bacillota bacterium]
MIPLPTLSGGSADVRFGEMSVDLQKCEQLSPDCAISLNCAFGELELIVPNQFRVEPTNSTAFAGVEISGTPRSDAVGTIRASCDVSFGEISIRYI